MQDPSKRLMYHIVGLSHMITYNACSRLVEGRVARREGDSGGRPFRRRPTFSHLHAAAPLPEPVAGNRAAREDGGGGAASPSPLLTGAAVAGEEVCRLGRPAMAGDGASVAGSGGVPRPDPRILQPDLVSACGRASGPACTGSDAGFQPAPVPEELRRFGGVGHDVVCAGRRLAEAGAEHDGNPRLPMPLRRCSPATTPCVVLSSWWGQVRLAHGLAWCRAARWSSKEGTRRRLMRVRRWKVRCELSRQRRLGGSGGGRACGGAVVARPGAHRRW
jgi:hypothetical protein